MADSCHPLVVTTPLKQPARPDSGSLRVYGRDPVVDPVGVLSRTGYLSEENDLPGWSRVDEPRRYSRAFYPARDDDPGALVLTAPSHQPKTLTVADH